jgi:hypothetical protein
MVKMKNRSVIKFISSITADSVLCLIFGYFPDEKADHLMSQMGIKPNHKLSAININANHKIIILDLRQNGQSVCHHCLNDDFFIA